MDSTRAVTGTAPAAAPWRAASLPLGVLGAVLLGPEHAALWSTVLAFACWGAHGLAGVARGELVLALLGSLLAGAALGEADAGRLRMDHRLDAEVDLRIDSVSPLREPQRFVARVERWHVTELSARQQAHLQRLRVSLYDPLPVQPGDRWHMCLRLRAPKGFSNPGGADFELRLFRERIGALGYVTSVACARRLQAASPGIAAQRAAAAGRLLDRLPDRGGRLLTAMLLGERGDFLPTDWDLLARTGTTHLVVVSGLHVGLVAALALWSVRGLWHGLLGRAGRLPPLLAAVALTTGYAVLTGFGLPVRRALLMFVVIATLGTLLRRVHARPVLLAWAATGVLLFDPLAVLDAGFWLSFLAVAALMLAWRAEPGTRWPWRAALRAQLAVALLLAPSLTLLFGQVPWAGPLVNLLLVPLVGILIMPLGLAGLLLSWLLPAGHLEAPLQLAAWLLVSGLEGLDGLSIEGPGLGLATPALALPATVGAALLVLPLPWPPRLLGAGLLVAMIQPPVSAPRAGQVRLDVLDVGQGLAVVVQTAHHAMLYDAGPRFGRAGDAGSLVVVPALRALGVRRLDLLLISHDDADHAGGARSVARRMAVAETLAGSPGGGMRPCRRGQHWRWDGVSFRILHPERRRPERSDNAQSCVLLIETDGRRVLLPGDAGRAVERRIIADLGRLDLLVLGHHGSDTSSGPVLLRRAQPRLAVAAAGLPNRFGHPHPAVRARLGVVGTAWLHTGRDGAVSWSSERPGNLRGHRSADARYWRWSAPQETGLTAADEP